VQVQVMAGEDSRNGSCMKHLRAGACLRDGAGTANVLRRDRKVSRHFRYLWLLS
jgi:hypothetical protein